VVVLSYLFWQRHFHADPTVIGRRLQLIHKNYTIVGVLPSRFTWNDADVYVPLKITNDANIQYGPLIRLKPGITHAAGQRRVRSTARAVRQGDAQPFSKKFRVHVQGINDRYVEHLGRSLFLLLGAVALLLLIGCANVSILLLARGTARQFELAVRAASGRAVGGSAPAFDGGSGALARRRAGRRSPGLSPAAAAHPLVAGIFVPARSGDRHQSAGCWVSAWLSR